MSTPALILPRRLAIALLAEAQKAAGSPVSGVITARGGVPDAVVPDGGAADEVWAHYRSGGDATDARPGRQLLISIDTKGVLQLRCWEGAVERELRII
jgi:hypothetical protein